MMRCLYFLLFVAACQAYVSRERDDAEDIPAPNLIRVTVVEDPSLALKVKWEPVSTSEASEPIVGYKIKVWEQERGKTYNEDEDNDQSRNSDEIRTHKLRDVVVHGADRTNAKFEGIEEGATYKVRVLAYTRNGDGPLSDPIKIKVSSRDHDRQRDVYNRGRGRSLLISHVLSFSNRMLLL